MNCKQCEGNFTPTTDWQRFCSDKCRNDWHNAQRLKAEKWYREHHDTVERLKGKERLEFF